jgi:hypothetical protein
VPGAELLPSQRAYRVELRRRRKLLGLGRTSYWWVIIHINGQVLATSETYTTRDACRDTACRLAEELGLAIHVND